MSEMAQSGHASLVDGRLLSGAKQAAVRDAGVLLMISNYPQVSNSCKGFNPIPIRVVIPETTDCDAVRACFA